MCIQMQLLFVFLLAITASAQEFDDGSNGATGVDSITGSNKRWNQGLGGDLGSQRASDRGDRINSRLDRKKNK